MSFSCCSLTSANMPETAKSNSNLFGVSISGLELLERLTCFLHSVIYGAGAYEATSKLESMTTTHSNPETLRFENNFNSAFGNGTGGAVRFVYLPVFGYLQINGPNSPLFLGLYAFGVAIVLLLSIICVYLVKKIVIRKIIQRINRYTELIVIRISTLKIFARVLGSLSFVSALKYFDFQCDKFLKWLYERVNVLRTRFRSTLLIFLMPLLCPCCGLYVTLTLCISYFGPFVVVVLPFIGLKYAVKKIVVPGTSSDSNSCCKQSGSARSSIGNNNINSNSNRNSDINSNSNINSNNIL